MARRNLDVFATGREIRGFFAPLRMTTFFGVALRMITVKCEERNG